MIESHAKFASYRKEGKHRLRELQDQLQGKVPDIIAKLNKKGCFPNTQIERVLASGQPLVPNDITKTQLEMIAKICRIFSERGFYPALTHEYLLVNLLDGADGALARHLDMTSPEGAMYDVIVDRLSETLLAKLIAKERGRYGNSPPDLERDLTTAFQLSTLTKASCEMFSIDTKEGGIGSMIERRRKLFSTLAELGTLRKMGSSDNLVKRELLKSIDRRNSSLIENSIKGAMKRIEKISNRVQTEVPTSWHTLSQNDDMQKYSAVVLLNRELGIDIVKSLNDLAGREIFPPVDYLREKYPTVNESLLSIKDLFDEALRIANINSSLY